MNAFMILRQSAASVCNSLEQSWRQVLKPPYRPARYEMEQLERRQLLSVAAAISATATVTEGDAYVVSLTASSTASTYSVTGWTISYGDGTTHTLSGSDTTDTYEYDNTSSPSYVVTAIVNDDEGGTSYSATASASVTVGEATPTLSISADTTASVSEWFVADQELADGGNHTLTGYTISWGDSTTGADAVPVTFTDSYIEDFEHKYTSLGTYTVSSTASTEQGTLTFSTSVVAGPDLYAVDGGNGYAVGQEYDLTPTFNDAGTGTLTGYTVSWGDGSSDDTYSSATTVFTHTYATDNSGDPYTPTLVAGTSDPTYYTAVGEAELAPPTLSLTAPTTATQGTEYTLTAAVTSGQTAGSSYDFDIDWGDGSDPVDESSAPGEFTYTYSEPGTYTVSVIADGESGSDIAEATLTATLAAPTISFEDTDATITAGVVTDFEDTYTNTGGDTVDNLTVAWGDGKIDAYYQDPEIETHDFAAPGDYTVTDTFATDDDTYVRTDVVHVTDNASFSISLDAEGEGLTSTVEADFADPNGETPTSYSVSWGDGNNNTYSLNPDHHGTFAHVYTLAGTVTATVTATTPDGTYTAYDSAFMDLDDPGSGALDSGAAQGGVPYPVPYFYLYDEVGNVTPDYPVPNHPTTYDVNWGDGATGTYTNSNFSHAYAYDTSPTTPTNSYEYTVTAHNSDYTSSYSSSVEVYPSLDGTLDVSGPGSGTEGTYVTASENFSDASQPATRSLQGAGSIEVFWGDGSFEIDTPDFGDPPLLTASPSHSYAEPGTYQLTFLAGYNENGTEGLIHNTSESVTIAAHTPTLTVAGNTTATVTGDTYTLSPTYTDSVGDHRTHDWTITWGDGTSDEFDNVTTPPSEFTHVYSTASTSGSTYSPTLSVTAFDLTEPVTATTNVIIAQPEMDLIQDDGTTLSQSLQHTTGGFIVYAGDDPDDDYDDSGDAIPEYGQTSLSNPDPDLTEVTLQPLPASVGGTYSVTIPSDLNVYSDQYKDTAISNGQTFDATAGQIFWVEGTAISSQMGIDKFAVDWNRGGESVSNADYANLSAVGIDGPQNVPADGIYTYRVAGAVPQPAGSTPWTITGGTKKTQSTGGDVCTIFWDSPPAGTAASAGWFGKVQFKTAAGVVVGPLRVNVVQVVIATPTASPAFTPGVPADNGHVLANKIDRQSVTSGTPGLAYSADVTLNGPILGTDMLGTRAITVGFVQDKTGYIDRGTYVPGTLVSSLEAVYGKGPVLDAASGQIWQGGGAMGTRLTHPEPNHNNAVIGANDTPMDGPPVGWRHAENELPGEPLLLSMTLTDTFGLFICAQTSDNDTRAQQVYVERASATWVFNGTGAVVGGVWKGTRGTAKVTAPTAWTSVTNGSEPVTTGQIANYLSTKLETFA